MATPDLPSTGGEGREEGEGLSAYARASPRARLGVAAAIVVIIAALVVTVVVGIVRGGSSPSETVPGADSAADGVSLSSTDLYVHVSGAVRAPGLYRLAEGARVVDAVAAALGFADDADDQAVNLARPVSDGEHLIVPVRGTDAAAAAAPGDGRINLNTASESELDELPRIGPAMAERIVQWRDAHGRFTSVEDLLAVPGIGDKMLETLRPLVTI